jgi:hypothetical protein
MYAVRERIPMNGANVSLGMSDGRGGMTLTVAGRF